MDLTKKKILVTGGAGFLGRHVIAALKKRGVPEKNILAPHSSEFDLRHRESCEKAAQGHDLVIHLAGITGNAEFHKAHPGTIFYENLVMGVELMNAARAAGVQKFVTIGSATEYPENAPLPFREENLWIGPVEPIHAAYTVAKKMLLVEAQAYRAQYGWNAIHLLLTNMYGPGEKIDGGPIPSLIKRIADAKAAKKNSIMVWGTGRATRDFLYVEDAAEGIVLAAEKYDEGDPVNLGSGYEVAIRELAESIARLMDFKGTLEFDATKPEGQPRRMLDVSRAERGFGFHASTDLKDGLKKTIASHGY